MPANHVNKEVGGEMPVVKRVGRFRKDDRTMMVYDTEKEVEPFPVEKHDEVARTLLDMALKRLAEAFIKVKKRS